VWFGWRLPDGRVDTEVRRFDGDRAAVRSAAAQHALAGLLQRLGAA
ncbi:MAG TPA: CinA family protein, partial [Burkholderiaceae bacterium]|nr:CinA family protein [Burkholderiaceae bacterium]